MRLSERDLNIVKMVLNGATYKQAAKEYNVSTTWAYILIQRVYDKILPKHIKGDLIRWEGGKGVYSPLEQMRRCKDIVLNYLESDPYDKAADEICTRSILTKDIVKDVLRVNFPEGARHG